MIKTYLNIDILFKTPYGIIEKYSAYKKEYEDDFAEYITNVALVFNSVRDRVIQELVEKRNAYKEDIGEA